MTLTLPTIVAATVAALVVSAAPAPAAVLNNGRTGPTTKRTADVRDKVLAKSPRFVDIGTTETLDF